MTLKSTVRKMMLGACVISSLTACSKSENSTATASDSESVHPATKTYQIGSDMTFPPFESMDNDKPVGFDIDVARKIFEKSGDQVNFVDTRFSNLISGLDAKKFDLVFSGLYITPERLKKVDMVPYYMTREALISIADATYQPKVRDELCGKTIGSQKGTLFPEQLHQISQENCVSKGKPAIVVREFETSPQAVQALLAKAVDAHYDDLSVAKSTVEKLKGRVVISSTDSFFPILGGIAVRKGDKETYDKLQHGLDEMKKSGEYTALIEKYNLQPLTDADIEKYMPK
ncbi:ABC transporter substrate-binding protein [Acinetobacter ihumii]|uniref:ABC transporter substrate-binding protein n=1 Tax=Acinetobacter ihumii TaxID=2483802 RepID=UPI00102FDE64|nr:ABC transporter substrate-binding protein [Acinetobacter ihumii]